MHLTADLSRPQTRDERAVAFFRSIPRGDQELTVLGWDKIHNHQLPTNLAGIRMWPGTQTAGQWLASQNGRLRT